MAALNERKDKMKKKMLAILLVMAMCLGLLAGCGNKNDPADAPDNTPPPVSSEPTGTQEKVTLSMMNIWCGADSKAAGWTDIVNAFNAEYQGVYEVVLEDQADYDAYVEKMKALISSGDTPDLFTFKADRLAEYSGTGELMDLSDAVYNTEVAGRYNESLLRAAEYEGTLYCIPYETAIIPMMYNANLLQAAGVNALPTSYDELYAVSEQLRNSGVYPIAQSTGSAAWFAMLHFSYCLAAVMGADIYDYAYDSPEWVEAAKLYQSLYPHSEDDMVGSDTSIVNGNFFNERAAIYCNGTWIVGRIASEGVAGLSDAIDVGGTLSYNGKNGGGYMSVVQAYIGAAATDDVNKQAAVKAFVEFVTRADQVLPLCQSSGSLFAVDIDTTQLAEGLQTDIISAASEATFLFDHVQDMMSSQVWAAFMENVEGLVLGETSAEDFCAALAAANAY